jgi:beta-N-acetylhexosaminidase
MKLSDLRGKPFFLDDEDITWVTNTLASLTLEEKVGQLFCPLGRFSDIEIYSKMLEEIAPGGIMFRPGPSKEARERNAFLQTRAKVPMLIAANLEAGGNGLISEGTNYGSPMQVAATDDDQCAYTLGRICGIEGGAVGCNWAFAPIIDIDNNCFNPITNTRTFGSDMQRVLKMGKAYMQGIQETGMAVSIKHFPGDGVDDRDQHLVTSINSLSTDQWDKTYGMLYKEMIESGAQTVMVGHIMLPEYSRKLRPDIKDAEIMPASLAPELLKDLLRDKLGFSGLVVTDSTSMAGFTTMMERRKAVPFAIAAGNDMFLFNKDIKEDFSYMLEGIKTGIITAERLSEAVTRILALKASLGLHKKQAEGTLVPNDSQLEKIGCSAHRKEAIDCADRSVTLVKDTQSLLPIDPVNHKRILLFPLGDESGYFSAPGTSGKHQEFKRLLEQEGFEVTVFDKKNESLEYLFEPVESFIPKYDLALYFANISTASNQTVTRITWAMPRGIDIPWFIEEKRLPSLFVSFANPYHLYDLPRIKTFINAYNSSSFVLEAVIEKLLGRSEFKGINPVDPFCGLWDARL